MIFEMKMQQTIGFLGYYEKDILETVKILYLYLSVSLVVDNISKKDDGRAPLNQLLSSLMSKWGYTGNIISSVYIGWRLGG